MALAAAGAAVRPAFGDDSMITKPIPSTGEALPVIGLGTWQTFDVGDDDKARAPLREVMEIFADAGGRLVDSSPMYGTSESVAGDLMLEGKLHERLFVATKVWTRGRDAGVRQIDASFRKLRVKRVDLLQVHNLLDVAVHTKSLAELKKKGHVRYIGVTHYASSAHADVERALDAHRYDFLQINYSLDEPEAEERLLPKARELGVAVIANRPFASGGMFRRVKGKPLPPWAAELGIASWAQYFLKWIVAHPAVTCAIPATSKPGHMRDNVAAGRGPLPDAAARRRMQEHYASL